MQADEPTRPAANESEPDANDEGEKDWIESSSDDDRLSSLFDVPPTLEPVPISSVSVPVPPNRRRAKTSTAAVSVVGEIGVPVPKSDESGRHPTSSVGERGRGSSIRIAQTLAMPDPGPPTPRDPEPGELSDLESTDEEPRPIPPEMVGSRRTEPRRNGAMLVVLGLAAVVVGAVVLKSFISPSGPKSRGTDEGASTSKPNRGEARTDLAPNEPGPSEASEPRPRKPDEARTRAGDPVLQQLRDRQGETGDESETGETGGEPSPNVHPRDPSVIPPGTPEEFAKAFSKLPVSVHDLPPVGGIGPAGIHIDEISLGHGFEDGDCTDQTREFSVAKAQKVNVCFRVVHPREEASVRVLWEKDGQTARRGGVRIPALHAYKTRAYLELRPEYVGSWRVRILAEGHDTELASLEFEIRE